MDDWALLRDVGEVLVSDRTTPIEHQTIRGDRINEFS